MPDRRAHRNRRHRSVRAKSFNAAELAELVRTEPEPPTQHEKRRLKLLRPRTRADCIDGPRPCPWVSCREHLYLDTSAAGSIKLNFPDLEPGELEHSCALDIADAGGATLEGTGKILNITRERARQIEVSATARYKMFARLSGLDEILVENAEDDDVPTVAQAAQLGTEVRARMARITGANLTSAELDASLQQIAKRILVPRPPTTAAGWRHWAGERGGAK